MNVTAWLRPRPRPAHGDLRGQITGRLRVHGEMSAREVARLLPVRPAQVTAELTAMAADGVAEPVPPRRWRLT